MPSILFLPYYFFKQTNFALFKSQPNKFYKTIFVQIWNFTSSLEFRNIYLV